MNCQTSVRSPHLLFNDLYTCWWQSTFYKKSSGLWKWFVTIRSLSSRVVVSFHYSKIIKHLSSIHFIFFFIYSEICGIVLPQQKSKERATSLFTTLLLLLVVISDGVVVSSDRDTRFHAACKCIWRCGFRAIKIECGYSFYGFRRYTRHARRLR